MFPSGPVIKCLTLLTIKIKALTREEVSQKKKFLTLRRRKEVQESVLSAKTMYKKSIARFEIFAEFNSRTYRERGGGVWAPSPRCFKKFDREDLIWVLVNFSNCLFIFDTHSRCEFGENRLMHKGKIKWPVRCGLRVDKITKELKFVS